MKITTYASAAAIAFAMSVGSVSAEEQLSVVKDVPLVSANESFSIAKDVPSATPMTSEQLGETVGGNEINMCYEDCRPIRRRWFHRRVIKNGCNGPCLPPNGT